MMMSPFISDVYGGGGWGPYKIKAYNYMHLSVYVYVYCIDTLLACKSRNTE